MLTLDFSSLIQELPLPLRIEDPSGNLVFVNNQATHYELHLPKLHYFDMDSRPLPHNYPHQKTPQTQQALGIQCNGIIRWFTIDTTFIKPYTMITFTPLNRCSQLLNTFESIFTTTPAGICITDKDGFFEKVNPAYCEIYGYTEEMLIGKHFTIVVPQEVHEVLSELHTDFITGKVEKELRGEWDVVNSRGEALTILADAARIVGEDGETKKATFVMDITEKKTYERQQDALIIQQARFALLGEMLDIMVHQWKQPLNTLGLLLFEFCETLKEEYSEIPNSLIHTFEQECREQILFMDRTTYDFRSFVHEKRHQEPFEPLEQIRTTLKLLKSAFKHNRITIHETLSPCPNLHGYPNEFQHAFFNILKNALDILKLKTDEMRWIRVSNIIENDTLIFTIEDNGGGIPKELLPYKLFENRKTLGKKGGSGVGLYLTHKIITEHFNGTINVNNTDVGACFSIRIEY